MNKYQYSNNTIYYQKARFFRKVGSGEFAYCIEPFSFFNENSIYEPTLNPNNLNSNQIEKISKIAHFGYGYKNHTDVKWYAITQMMIWQEANSSTGSFYFTDSLNGNRINPYDNEINEINNLINNHNTLPSMTNNTYDIIINSTLSITDNNNVLSNYTSNNNDLKIENNTLTITPKKEGTFEYSYTRQDNVYNKPFIFYQANNSQNLVETGNLNDIKGIIKVNVYKTSISIKKIDKDTKDIKPSGKASLDGATYMLYDKDRKEIKKLDIKNNYSIINNIDFGTYYIKEITPGTGYKLNNEETKVIISKDNPNIELELENEVIKKKITIQKKYGDNNTEMNEKNIYFDIYDDEKNYITSISTNELGYTEIVLPYNKYTFIQKNTTEGYNKVEPFSIDVKDDTEENIVLKDLKIEVPNTHIDENNNVLLLLLIIICQIL